MSSSKNIIIRYEGESLNNGEMDIQDFASSLLAFGNYLQEAHDILYGTEHTLSVRVKSNFERGSFIVGLDLSQAPIKELIGIFSGQGLSALSNFLQIAGGVKGAVNSIFWLLKRLGNRKHKVIELSDGDVKIRMEAGEIEEFTVKKSVYALAMNPGVRYQIECFVKPLGKDGISAIEIGDNSGTTEKTRIEKLDYESFLLPSATRDTIEQERETFVQIVSPTFKSGNKWRVRIDERDVSATMSDTVYIERVINGYESFNAKTVLKVQLKTTEKLSVANEIKYEYDIVKVIETINQNTLFE
jgi:hypothetical protein